MVNQSKGMMAEKLKLIKSIKWKMAVKIIKCPSCGEEIVLTDLYDGMEVECNLCNSIMIYNEGKLHVLDTNEEFDIDELELEEEEFKEDLDEFEDEYYFEEEY